MSLLLALGLAMAQAPASAEPPAVEVKKSEKSCQMIRITGSRSKRKVCRDEAGNLDLGPGVSNSGFGKAKIDQSGAGSTSSSIGQ